MRFQFVFEAKDYEAALRFYGEGLGLPVEYSWDRGADKGTFFRAAAGIVEVVSDAMNLRGPNKLGICIEVDDVDAVYQRILASGVTVEQAPSERSWGTREFFLIDPDGHAVTFFQEPKEA